MASGIHKRNIENKETLDRGTATEKLLSCGGFSVNHYLITSLIIRCQFL